MHLPFLDHHSKVTTTEMKLKSISQNNNNNNLMNRTANAPFLWSSSSSSSSSTDVQRVEMCLHFFFIYVYCFFQTSIDPVYILWQHHHRRETTTMMIIKTEATNYASSKISNGYLIGCNEYIVMMQWMIVLVNHASAFFYRGGHCDKICKYIFFANKTNKNRIFDQNRKNAYFGQKRTFELFKDLIGPFL